jgi:RND family efflux transporter MFP subunit
VTETPDAGKPAKPVSQPPRRRRPFALALAIAAIASAGTAGWLLSRPHQAEHIVAVNPTPALTVAAVQPRRVRWPVALEASGSIAAWQEASIGARVGGYGLIEVLVNVGDQVRKGDVLARFDPSLLQADAARLQANAEQAKANEQRTLSLQKTGTVSDRDALQFVTQARTAEALQETNRLQLRYTEVVAPDDGVISSRTATLGAVVPVGQELFRLIRQNRLEWRGELTAEQLVHVEVGQRVQLRLPGGGVATAIVRQLAPSLDPRTRLGIVYADIVPGSAARAGMYAEGGIITGESEATVVPTECVSIRDGRGYVLKLMDGGPMPRVALQPVVIGRRQGSESQVVEGVRADDRLVAAGAGFLNDGDVVRLAETTGGGRAEASP